MIKNLLHSVKTGCGAQPPSYPALCSGVKRLGYETDQSSSNAEVKNDEVILPLLIAIMT
jgi:hypothetical protein